jgi:predicted RNase H-like nuclease (RuvC/YqgF family)
VSAMTTARSVVTHRGMTCLELHRKLGELTRRVRQLAPRAEQATHLEARIDEQALTINSLRDQLAKAKDIRADLDIRASRCIEAEMRADALTKDLEEQTVELVALRQFKANVCSVSTLPPAGPVAPPADRFETGSPVRLGASPMASTSPVPSWAREDDTVPVPVITPVEPAA